MDPSIPGGDIDSPRDALREPDEGAPRFHRRPVSAGSTPALFYTAAVTSLTAGKTTGSGGREVSLDTCVGGSTASLDDVVDVLYSQPTLNERGDEDIMSPTENPETGRAAVRPTKKHSLSVNPHRGDRVER